MIYNQIDLPVYNLFVSRIFLYFTWGKISFNQELPPLKNYLGDIF
jgi:hypothetical protein